MFTNQWRRIRRNSSARRGMPRLGVERLEGRDVPSTVMYGGSVSSASQSYNHPNAAGTALSGQVVDFQAMALHVSTDDIYTMTNESNSFSAPSAGDGFFALYQTSFNPNNPLNNLVAANDNAGGSLGLQPQITQELVPGTSYFLVTSPATGGSTGSFINQISSPGTGTFTFSTHSLPAVDDPILTNVAGTSATLGGVVEGDGGATVTDRGVVYSIASVNGTPTIGGAGVTQDSMGSGTGSFMSGITGLTLGTTYAFRAYATNAVGTYYTSPVTTFVANTTPVLGGMIATAQNILDTATVQPFILATVTDPDSPPQTETLSVVYPAANGTFTTLGGFTGSAGDYTVSGTAAAVQTALRGLTFVPTPGQVAPGESVTTDFTVTDSDGFASATDSETNVVATAADQPPTVANAIPNQTFTGAGIQSFTFAANTFADSDPSITLNYTATLSAGGSLPSWLSFNAAARTFSGDPGSTDVTPLSIRVTAQDGKGNNVHDDFQLSLINVNDAPVLTPGTPTLPGISATIASSANTGELVSTLIGNRITDGDANDPHGIAIESDTTGAGGTWQYATDGVTWTNVPTGASASTPLLLKADSTDSIRFMPSTNATSTPTITYVAWDGTAGGAEGSLSNVNPNGGGGTSAFSTASETASLVVTVAGNVPVTVAGVQINDGSAQRSEVTSITVTFSGPVNFNGGNDSAAQAFQLQHLTDSNFVALTSNVSTNGQGQTTVTLTFSGSETDFVSSLNGGAPSLTDGRYSLTVFSADVTGSNGLAFNGGTNYVSPTDTLGGGPGQLHLFRLYGDATGNGVVDAFDLGVFRSTFNTFTGDPAYLWYMDADGGGAVDATSLAQFRERFNATVF
jgi:Putative Ig domain